MRTADGLIRDAVLYLPADGDLPAASLHVAGRPLVFRAVVAIVRAGGERVHVPGALREVLTPALADSPTALRAVAWMDAGGGPPVEGALVVPVTAPPPALTLALLGSATPTAVIEPSRPRVPVAAVPRSLLGDVWPSLCRGVPVGDRLDALLKSAPRTAVRAEPGAHVRDAASVRTAEDALFAGLGSVVDSPLDTAVHRRLSRYISRFAVARGIPPNPITIASLLVGLGAAVAFLAATPVAALVGLFLYLAAVVLDHADGEVARLTLTESKTGAWLDIVADTVVHVAVVLALGAATYATTGRGLAIGVVAAMGVIASATTWFRWPVANTGEDHVGTFLQNLGSRDGFYLMLLIFLAGLRVVVERARVRIGARARLHGHPRHRPHEVEERRRVVERDDRGRLRAQRVRAHGAALLVPRDVVAVDRRPHAVNLVDHRPDHRFREEPLEEEELVLRPVPRAQCLHVERGDRARDGVGNGDRARGRHRAAWYTARTVSFPTRSTIAV